MIPPSAMIWMTDDASGNATGETKTLMGSASDGGTYPNNGTTYLDFIKIISPLVLDDFEDEAELLRQQILNAEGRKINAINQIAEARRIRRLHSDSQETIKRPPTNDGRNDRWGYKRKKAL